jgi:hypothetical protein
VLFSAFFAITNLLVQIPELNLTWVRDELANGRLALRVTSVICAASFVWLAVQISRLERREAPTGAHPSFYSINEEILERLQREGAWSPERMVARLAIFSITFALVWGLVLADRSSGSIATLNWLLAFVVDDYVLVIAYRIQRQVTPPGLHATRIRLANLAMSALLIVVAFQNLPMWSAWLIIALLIINWTAGRLYSVVTHLLAGYFSIGIMPDDDDADDNDAELPATEAAGDGNGVTRPS